MDHADLIMMRATSPVLICAATRDFFDIGGVWDTFRYAKRLYTRMGFAERVDIMENDAGHNYNTLQREAVARWMSRWLLHKNQAITEPPITLLSEQEYQCTPDGKVMSLPGARSVYDLNEDYENELAGRRAAAWASGDREAQLEQVRRLAGIRKLSQLPKPAVESLGTVARAGYKIEKLFIKPEEGVSLPALLFSAREAETRARSCCTSINKGRRPTRRRAGRSSSWSRPASPCWPSISAAPARRRRPPAAAAIPTNSRMRTSRTC